VTPTEVARLSDEVRALAAERNAVILAHNYQRPEVQDVADYVGDSLGLSQQAAATDADVIVFAGVHFMAEVAKILNPERVVVVPDLTAGCSLADGCPPELFRRFLDKHPGHTVVSYINCSAAVKAMSDVICTSSNAVKIVESIPREQPIVFAPDQHLGRYVMKRSGRELVLWPGSCIVHETFSERKMIGLKERYPEAKIIAHPECEDSILHMADFIGSTTALLKYSISDSAKGFIVATESGIVHQMRKASPQKQFIEAPPDGNCACNECPHMKRNTLEKVYLALRDLAPRIEMPVELRERARRPIDRMLALS
jgi:quinolinate synthase